MKQSAPDFDALRKIANRIANGDWQRAPFEGRGGKLDFVDLEQRIYDALISAAEPNYLPMQSLLTPRAVADFTRVCEQTGIIEQLRKE